MFYFGHDNQSDDVSMRYCEMTIAVNFTLDTYRGIPSPIKAMQLIL